MESDLFQIKLATDLGTSMGEGEEITCLSGSSTQLFVGTSKGRIFHLHNRDGSVKAIGNMQFSTGDAVTSICFASALDLLLVLQGDVLNEISLEGFQTVGQRGRVTQVTLNSCPTTDDPFHLQYAVATSNKQIHLLEKRGTRTETITKIYVEGSVEALDYSKNCVCFATAEQYFVWCGESRAVLPLFPIDATVKPLICGVDTEEFLVSGMEGLAVFVTGGGVSNRPPVVWQAFHTRSFVYSTQYIHALASEELYVVDIVDLQVKQRVAIPGGSLLSNLDGCLFACTSSTLLTLNLVPWHLQVESLLSRGQLAEAQSAIERVAGQTADPEAIVKVLHLRGRIAFMMFFAGQLEAAAEMMRACEMDPVELAHLFPRLAFPHRASTFHDNTSIAKGKASEEEYMVFLVDYLESIRDDVWARRHVKLIDTLLLQTNVLRGEEVSVSGRVLDMDRLDEFLHQQGRLALLAHIAFQSGAVAASLDLYRKLATGEVHDDEFDVGWCVKRLADISDPDLFRSTLEWLIPHCPKECAEKVLACRQPLEPLLPLFTPFPHQYLSLCERVCAQLTCDGQLHTRLALLYIENINKAHAEGGDSTMIRARLRRFLLTSGRLDRARLNAELMGVKHLQVEAILLDSETDAAAALSRLIEVDLDAAELLCEHLASSQPQLSLSLLQHYVESSDASVKPRIACLVSALGYASDPVQVLRQLPSTLPVQAVQRFLMCAVASKAHHLRTTSLQMALIDKMLDDSCLPANRHYETLESTRCAVCGCGISFDKPVVRLSTGFTLHSACHVNKAVCPVTNTILL